MQTYKKSQSLICDIFYNMMWDYYNLKGRDNKMRNWEYDRTEKRVNVWKTLAKLQDEKLRIP